MEFAKMYSFVFALAFVISLMIFFLCTPAANRDLSDETLSLKSDEEELETSIIPNNFWTILARVY
jgi:hypothetical protein